MKTVSLRPGRYQLWVLVAAVLVSAISLAAEVRFRKHDLNPESTYCACAAVDVNRDGKLDVVCGGFWYEAPTWKKRFLRDVEEIRGRYDDYSNLPVDVNGDSWTDLISANYRSQKIYWIEHPGPELGEWKAHVVDQPGRMETARLYDIDGDGQLDLLPNALDKAMWWEFKRPQQKSKAPQWIVHPLPQELAGHGIGFGDINGDGRGDLVGPTGWCEAPKDPRKGRWIWHPDFRLHRDGSIPILVHDVDGDGDSDLVYGRAHGIGMYWVEQQNHDDKTAWVRHVIDTSWSQPHSILLADIDNDGADEVVAGKRYMGHDGKDPGEYDPLCAYWYDFDPRARTFRRGVITEGERAGFGLDPKAADLDGDGDVDILCPGRSGLYWMENLLVHDGPRPPVRPSIAPAYRDHADVLAYVSGGKLRTATSHAEWAVRRAHVLANMETVMGRLPDSSRRVPLDVKVLDEQETPKYIRKRITYAAEPGDRVPAYLLVPKNAKRDGAGMLCLHPTGKPGKDIPAGLANRANRNYAHELAERGYVCLVPDYPSFGDYEYDFGQDGRRYVSGTMKAVWNNIRGVDLLESLPEVHPDRIGVIGHSLGGHNGMFTAAFDQRIRAVVSSCGFTGFHDYYGGKLAGWTSDRYMPRIRDLFDNDPDKMPFDFHEVVAAFAPRAFFSSSPVEDGNFDVDGVKKVIASAEKVYKLTGKPDRLQVVYPDCGHDFPPEIRRQAYEWLDRQLKN